MVEWISNNLITFFSSLIIVIVFGCYSYNEARFYIIAKKLKRVIANKSLDTLKGGRLENLSNSYMETVCINTASGIKSNAFAADFFNEVNVCKEQGINLRLQDTASGTLVGLGLLGTFLGLTIGIVNFKSGGTEEIQASIQGLLSGMGTAFLTSLFGMGASIVYTWIDKFFRNMMVKRIYALDELLDSQNYIDDVSLLTLRQEEQTIRVTDQLLRSEEMIKISLEQYFSQLFSQLDDRLSYTNEGGDIVPIANATREILRENAEQTKALKAFSTDLAIQLNDGFEQVMSRQLQEKILPLMENVDSTTKAVVEHIDMMAAQVASPATDMIQSVVDELKSSMSSIVDEFKTGLSGSATNELENLAAQLGTATQAMADFPRNMENISSTLQVTIEEVKTAISEISNTSANANSTAMQQMQEQISFATGAISNAINEVKNVMSGITQSSQEQSNQMVSKLADAADKMGAFLNGTMSTLSASVRDSMKSITDDVTSKQADLIALQEDTTSQTKRLLEQFNLGLERLEKMNEYIQGTMNMFQQAQGQITGSTAHLQTITGDMKLATQLFNKSQTDYNSKMEELQRNSQRGIDSVTELLRNSGQLSEDYVEKFETIKLGLSSIFSQLKAGLTEYSLTVQNTTQKYLDQYSTSLTNTTDALSTAISQQSEVVEMLVESLNSHKK